MHKSIYRYQVLVALYALVATFSCHASDVWNWDEQFYQTHIRPQAKDIRKARQSYEDLLRTTQDRPNMMPNPFFVLDRMKKLPAEIQQIRAKRWLTEKDRWDLHHKEMNYAKFLNMMQLQPGGKISHGEIGEYHPHTSKFIRSYINNPELIDQPVTYYADYPEIEKIKKNLSIKDLGDYQGAIREKIQEHKFSSLFNKFTKRVYNYWNRK